MVALTNREKLTATVVCLALILNLAITNTGASKSGKPGVSPNSTCGQYLQSYATRLARVVHCSATNARPFTVCENCMDLYENYSKTYEKMMKSEESDGTRCRDILLDSDKIQVVRQLNSAIDDVWDRSQCRNCYQETIDGKGEVGYVLSNSTETFNSLINSTLQCIRENTNETLFAEKSDGTRRTNDTVCEICAADYKSLNRFYNSLGSSVNELCMDTVDKMNSTRIVWSKHLQCLHHHNTIWGLFLCTSVIGLLPVAFYFMLWLQADKQEHCVIPQKRLVAMQRAAISLT